MGALTNAERWWSHVDRRGEDECWEWQASRYYYGHGRFSVKTKPISAHRWGYEFLVGPIPEGMFVCHHCDNPPCVNPKHLFVGTARDNMLDKMRKGRQGNCGSSHQGVRNGRAKLTLVEVESIRCLGAQGATQLEIARLFGISPTQTARILKGESWKSDPCFPILSNTKTSNDT